MLPLAVLGVYLRMGVLQILLKVVRGQPCSFVELFLGGRQFLPFLAIEILYGLLVGCGMCLCIVPGVFLTLMFFLAPLLVLDQRVPVMDSFGMSKGLTDAHWANLFLLGLIVVGLSWSPRPRFSCACGSPPRWRPIAQLPGLVVVVPYISLLYVVVYRTLAGEPGAALPPGDQSVWDAGHAPGSAAGLSSGA